MQSEQESQKKFPLNIDEAKLRKKLITSEDG